MVIAGGVGAAGDELGRKVIRRSRGEAIDIATAAGLAVSVTVLAIDEGQVRLLLVAPKDVRFRTRTRQEAERHERRRRA